MSPNGILQNPKTGFVEKNIASNGQQPYLSKIVWRHFLLTVQFVDISLQHLPENGNSKASLLMKFYGSV